VISSSSCWPSSDTLLSTEKAWQSWQFETVALAVLAIELESLTLDWGPTGVVPGAVVAPPITVRRAVLVGRAQAITFPIYKADQGLAWASWWRRRRRYEVAVAGLDFLDPLGSLFHASPDAWSFDVCAAVTPGGRAMQGPLTWGGLADKRAATIALASIGDVAVVVDALSSHHVVGNLLEAVVELVEAVGIAHDAHLCLLKNVGLVAT